MPISLIAKVTHAHTLQSIPLAQKSACRLDVVTPTLGLPASSKYHFKVMEFRVNRLCSGGRTFYKESESMEKDKSKNKNKDNAFI